MWWDLVILVGKSVAIVGVTLSLLVICMVLWEEYVRPNRYVIKAFWSVMNMLRKRESVYAIGFRGAVELRAARKPPRAVKSEVERDTFRLEYQMFQDDEGHWKRKRVKLPHKILLDNTIHVGGRVLKTVNWNTMFHATGVDVRIGTVQKLTKAQAIRILGKTVYGD